MPMQSVDNHLVTQFSDMMHVAAQQRSARMRPYVEIRRMTGDVYAYDGLGQVEAREIQGRVQQTEFADIDHNRRKIARRQFEVTLPIDQTDIEAELTNPESNYAMAVMNAMERVFDRVVYDCLYASVYTGRDFTTLVDPVTDGVLTVNATSGFGYNSLLTIRQNFIDNEVGNDAPVPIALLIAGSEHTSLMKELQLTNNQYTNNMVVDQGNITKAAGIDLVRFGANANIPVLSVVGGVRNLFALAKGSVCVGMSRDWQITIKDRPDYVNVKQVQVTGVLGAVRTEGKLIQRVQTTAA